MIQIQRVKRPNDFLGHPICKGRRENDRENGYQQNGLEHHQNQRQHRCLTDGDTQHSSVIQRLGIVKRPLCEGGGVADAAAFPFRKRFPDLDAVCVVFHIFRGIQRIKQHRAVRRDPGQAVVRGPGVAVIAL